MAEALYFEDFEVGREWTTNGRTVTTADIVAYAGVSGDFHPIHMDEDFAKTTQFGGRIAHGPLLLAMSAGLVNRLNLVDGTAIALLGIDEYRMQGVVKPGDTIHVKFTVTEQKPTSKPDRGVIKRFTEIVNQRGETVQSMTMVYLMKCKDQ